MRKTFVTLLVLGLLVASMDASNGERWWARFQNPSRGGGAWQQNATQLNDAANDDSSKTTIHGMPNLTAKQSGSHETIPYFTTTNTSTTLEGKRLQFLNRMAWISETWMRKEQDAAVHSNNTTNLTAMTTESDLRLPGRHFHIVTTAALPWFTGTSVNPLLRAAYLHQTTQYINHNSTTTTEKQQWVTLVVPWLELPQDQELLYGQVFATQDEQEDYIRAWLRDRAGMPAAADPETGLRMLFYPARYHSGLCSIFAMGDLLQLIEEKGGVMDVCVLEEPEHVNWFRAPGDGWTMKYQFVVGIVHTSKSSEKQIQKIVAIHTSVFLE